MGKNNKFDFNNIKFNSRSNRSDRPERKIKKKTWVILSIVIAFVLVLAVALSVIIGNIRKNEEGRQVADVTMTSLPYKTTFYIGEEASYTGLVITTTLNNGTTYTDGPEACTFSGFDSRFAESNQVIYVTYGEYSFVYSITIKERPREASALVSATLISLPKTEYKIGDPLSVSGGILKLEYENGTNREIQLKYNHISNFSSQFAGTFTIVVFVEEDGYLATCTYEITVVAPTQNE